jgi:regulator of cell morphogenesis and NO signaling
MDSNFPVNQILQRYHLPVDNNLLYSFDSFSESEIDQKFIYTLLQTFENENLFSEIDYKNFSLEVIIDYIRRTHKFYLTKKLCEIEQSIQILLKNYSQNHPLLHVLNTFFFEYKNDLTHHIHCEEKQLLPYINGLLRFENNKMDIAEFFSMTRNYSLQKFIDGHLDTEKDLSNVRRTILEYHPPKTNQTPYRILLMQLQTFEKDLSVHALVEDKVLIPRALELEEKMSFLFSQKVLDN